MLTCLSLPQDINELKVFVDLASISAGENDIDVDRVACFHDAMQGYASLLYKLDASAGFDAFMTHLEELWKALENDPHLPHKLVSLPSGWIRVHEAAHTFIWHHEGRSMSHPRCVAHVK